MSTSNMTSPPAETPDSTIHPPLTTPRKTSKRAHITVLKKAVAELVGTFILVFAATAGAILDQKYDGIQTLLGSAACSGVAVMIIVYSIGHISKAHLNPAVTIAYAALGHFPWAQVPIFLVAEIVGSISASFLVKAAYHPFMFGGVTIPSVSVGQAFLLEFVATFFLMFVIIPVATDATAVGNLAGVAIGGVVMLDILIIGPATGASMNPARTLGPAIVTGRYTGIWIYMLAPPMGAVSGGAVYALIKLPKED
ncbi:probable aquaporin NIP5-1 [Beta vulgaris subsp. vulgaris]|uniref:probable aquaporin NIP5-1 n=1 Tax=Beta vulgaris subsp. vulgaris TaxID=3555 RepID=UPI002036C439|nr:probable aquaporin NIP5-1 [Beta vulgaris subsp. vulgaris]